MLAMLAERHCSACERIRVTQQLAHLEACYAVGHGLPEGLIAEKWAGLETLECLQVPIPQVVLVRPEVLVACYPVLEALERPPEVFRGRPSRSWPRNPGLGSPRP